MEKKNLGRGLEEISNIFLSTKENANENSHQVEDQCEIQETVTVLKKLAFYNDKNAIGHMDYENLAEEVIRSKEARTYQNLNTSNVAQDLLKKTEEYIDTAAEFSEDELAGSEMDEFSEDESPASEIEEFSAYSSQSNYSQMVDVIANRSTGSFSNDEDEI